MNKYYQGAADIISSRWSDAPTPQARQAVADVADDLAQLFKRHNGNFKYTRFFDACGLPVPAKHAGSR
jgi:hypothetical protein